MAKRARRDVQEGMRKMSEMVDSMIDKHLDPANQPPRSKLSIALGLIPHIIVVLFATSVVWVAKPSSSLFSWHPTLMCLAYAVLMSEAILFFSPWSSPITQLGARSSKVRWHWVLQGCSLLTSFTGIVVITANKILNSYSHYTSYHGIIGIFLSGFIFLQTSGGIVEMYPEILPFKVRVVTLKRLHALFGSLTYLGGVVTLTLGLYSGWFVANTHPVLWRVCVACPTLLGCSVLVQVFRNHVWRW